MKSTTWVLAFASPLLFVGVGHAQSATGSARATVAADGLTEVVVTAQRREEKLKDVPLSVTVASAEQFDEHNFTGPSQLSYLVPSLQLTNFQASPGATNFSVRGVGTASFSNLIEPSVATVIDGVVMGRPEMGVMEFSDLQRVEVLGGPQGMLFGKNASAGLVNIVTVQPKIGVYEASAHVAWEDINAVNGADQFVSRVTVNAPVSDTSALRISGFYTKMNPLITELGATPQGEDLGQQEEGIRAKYLWRATDEFTVSLAGDYVHENGMGSGAYTARRDVAGSPLLALDQASGIVAGPTNLYRNADAPTDLHYSIAGGQNDLNYTLANGITLTNIAAWREYTSFHTLDFDLRDVNILNLASAQFHFNQFTEEFRLTSPSGGWLEYQAGLYYYYGKSNRTDLDIGQLNLGTPPVGYTAWLGLISGNNLTTNSRAVYGQATAKLAEGLKFTAGARYTNDDVSLAGYNQQGGALYTISLPGDHSYTPSQQKSNVSWRSSLQYELTPAVTSYLTVARGYKGPGYNLSWGGAQPVGAETSTDYEGGIKANIASTLQFNASVFWENFTDFQVQSFDPASASYIVQNAGKLRSRGLEAQLDWKPVTGLTLSAGMTYNDAVFTRFTGAACWPGQSAAQGCLATGTDASGNRLPNVPRLAGTFAGDYLHPVTSDLNGFLHADLYSRGAVNFSANGDPNTVQGAYTLLGLSVGVSSSDEHWKVSIYCRNCTDKRFVTYIEGSPVGAAGDYNQSFGTESFRSIGLAADFRF